MVLIRIGKSVRLAIHLQSKRFFPNLATIRCEIMLFHKQFATFAAHRYLMMPMKIAIKSRLFQRTTSFNNKDRALYSRKIYSLYNMKSFAISLICLLTLAMPAASNKACPAEHKVCTSERKAYNAEHKTSAASCAALGADSNADSDTAAMKALARFAGNLLTYHNRFTQEKVYLHLDNNGYIPGEKIWFKAYVFNAASLLPTDMSKVLYAELLDPYGQLIERKTLPVDNGRTYGNFNIDPVLCRSGYYEVRAYTRAMLNWDNAFIFSRVIPIFDEPKDSVNFTDLSIRPMAYDNQIGKDMRAQPQALVDSSTQKQGKMRLAFYPEGGYITRSLPSRVAFKLTDRDGLPLNAEVRLFRSDGQSLGTARVEHDGMGAFLLPADFTGGYAVVSDENKKDRRFTLPQPRVEGASVVVDSCDEKQGLCFKVLCSPAYKGQALGLSLTCRGRLCWFKDIVGTDSASLRIPADKLREGVLQLTLFTPRGEVMSERLVWSPRQLAAPTLTIRQNADSYAPFSPIVLDIDLRDAKQSPLQADFSLAVRDAGSETGTDAASLPVNMLLCSDLKGYIHNPSFYFADNSAARRHALDLLLMVQGYRRYSWREMAGLDAFRLRQPAEDGLLLLGSMNATRDAVKNLQKEHSLDLNFVLNTTSGTRFFAAQTQKDGSFAIRLPDFYEDAPSIITVTNDKDRRVYTELRLNRNFSPAALPYEPLALAKEIEIGNSRISALAAPSQTFEWEDTIPDLISKIIQLHEVKISAKRTMGYQPSSRFTWMKGEEGTKRFARYYYNLRDELDRYQDEGRGVPSLWDWLKERNPNFYCDPDGSEKTYKGQPVCVIIDNDRQENGRLPDVVDNNFLMNDFRALVIVDNNAMADRVLSNIRQDGAITMERDNSGAPADNTAVNSLRGATFFLYSRPEEQQTTYYKRGTRWLTLHGYSMCDDFFSPDYRLSDTPTATDHRRTLYWNPSLTTDVNGHANVIFYSSSRPNERLVINMQGIAVNGQLFSNK